ncbi:hypothetical protein [Pseudonocardia nigra]|uniref:hypothetical protein n=1 Tax=Pseudonocardia nigra TaxID=1921578 RepID=UPI001C604C6B|nr:hypothetical protein [Pseudonocardia nigra]
MTVVLVVCGAGAVSAIWPAVEHAVVTALICAPLVAGAVWVLRREARIRRRLADATGAPDQRVGPGDLSPALPAPSKRTNQLLSRAAAEAGRASDTTGAPS